MGLRLSHSWRIARKLESAHSVYSGSGRREVNNGRLLRSQDLIICSDAFPSDTNGPSIQRPEEE